MATRAYIDSYSAESVDEIKGLIPALLDQIFKLMAEVGLVGYLTITVVADTTSGASIS